MHSGGDQRKGLRRLTLPLLALAGSTLIQIVVVRGGHDVVVPLGRGPRNRVVQRGQQEQQAEKGHSHGWPPDDEAIGLEDTSPFGRGQAIAEKKATPAVPASPAK